MVEYLGVRRGHEPNSALRIPLPDFRIAWFPKSSGFSGRPRTQQRIAQRGALCANKELLEYEDAYGLGSVYFLVLCGFASVLFWNYIG